MYNSYASFKRVISKTKPLEQRKDLYRQYLLQQCGSILGFDVDFTLKSMEQTITYLDNANKFLNRKSSKDVWNYIEKLSNQIENNNKVKCTPHFLHEKIITCSRFSNQPITFSVASMVVPCRRLRWILCNKKLYGNL